MNVWIDKTHSQNHIESCFERYSSFRCKDLDNVDTESAEQFFSFWSCFKHVLKHMNKHRFHFFTLYMMWKRNLQNERKLKNCGRFKCGEQK